MSRKSPYAKKSLAYIQKASTNRASKKLGFQCTSDIYSKYQNNKHCVSIIKKYLSHTKRVIPLFPQNRFHFFQTQTTVRTSLSGKKFIDMCENG